METKEERVSERAGKQKKNAWLMQSHSMRILCMHMTCMRFVHLSLFNCIDTSTPPGATMASATSANAATTPVSSTTSTNSHNHSNTASTFTSPGSSSTPRSGPNAPATTAVGPGGEPSAGTSSPTAESNAAELAAAAATATEETRQDLELKLKELIECLLELSITVYDFQPESNSLVHQKMYMNHTPDHKRML